VYFVSIPGKVLRRVSVRHEHDLYRSGLGPVTPARDVLAADLLNKLLLLPADVSPALLPYLHDLRYCPRL